MWELDDDSDATMTRMTPVTPWNEGALLLQALHVACPFSVVASLSESTTLRHNGVVYRYDPRLVALENTLESPADLSDRGVDAGHGAPATYVCPTTFKTFLNEDTCMLTHGCLPYQYSTNAITLDDATVRLMYTAGRTIALILDDIPIQITGSSEDPCRNPARFKRLLDSWPDGNGGPCSNFGGETGRVNSATRTIFADLIRSSSDPNPNIKDVDYDGARSACDSDITGAIIEVDGVCWQNTNRFNLNVYDLTQFSIGMEHPGNL